MKKKILFFGTPEIAVPSLKTINNLPDYEIVGVGVFPDKPIGRKQVLTPNPVKIAAQSLGLKTYELQTKTELEALFKNVDCDLAIVIAFGMIFPANVLNVPPLGVINVHFSLLPAYRGASPVQAAILEGLTETGITWQRMVPALDAGDILWQTKHDITAQTTVQVWNNFSELTAEQFPTFLQKYTEGALKPQPQNELEATFCGKFKKSDGHLTASNYTAETIYNTWRAFQPWPGVSLDSKKGLLKLKHISLEPDADSVAVACAENSTLYISIAQIPGKKPQDFKTIMNQNPGLL